MVAMCPFVSFVLCVILVCLLFVLLVLLDRGGVETGHRFSLPPLDTGHRLLFSVLLVIIVTATWRQRTNI